MTDGSETKNRFLRTYPNTQTARSVAATEAASQNRTCGGPERPFLGHDHDKLRFETDLFLVYIAPCQDTVGVCDRLVDLLDRIGTCRSPARLRTGAPYTTRRLERGRSGPRCVDADSPSDLETGEAPCGAHVFEGFFGLENGPAKSDKSQEKTLFGKEMPEDASRHPKPTSYPQTRQDTVVRVFPMESSN